MEDNSSMVQRERSEGHQVCVCTYAHSDGTTTTAKGSSGASTDIDSLVDDLDHGMRALSDALDGEEPSRIVRLQDTLSEAMAVAIDSRVKASVGWNVDTGDWVEGNVEAIYSTLMGVESGDIVLLHDGGGDRSATVEALRKALPRLEKRGYSFVTIDDLMGYPAW